MKMDLDEKRMATMLSGMIAEVGYKDGNPVLNAVSKLQNDEHDRTAIDDRIAFPRFRHSSGNSPK